jgi:hypothetical protein
VNVPVRVLNSQVIVDQMLLQTDFLTLQGGGLFGLDKTVFARTLVQIEPALSASLVAIVPQLQLLLNARGEIEVPAQIQGQFPRLLVLPDQDFIVQKIFASTAQELLTRLVDKPAGAGEAGVQKSVLGLINSKDDLKKLLGQMVSGNQK